MAVGIGPRLLMLGLGGQQVETQLLDCLGGFTDYAPTNAYAGGQLADHSARQIARQIPQIRSR